MLNFTQTLSTLNKNFNSVIGNNDHLYRILTSLEYSSAEKFPLEAKSAMSVAYAVSSGRVSGEIHNYLKNMLVLELVNYCSALAVQPAFKTMSDAPRIMSEFFHGDEVSSVEYSDEKGALCRLHLSGKGSISKLENGNYCWKA